MKSRTAEFKNNIKILGRELDSIITYELNGDTIELGNENLNSVSPHYEGGILKSVMKVLDIDSDEDIPIGTVLNYQFGIKVRNEEVEDYRDNYDYIDFGNYVVYSSEKQEDKNSYKIICYDYMLNAMKDYEKPKINNTAITYPITIRNYINAISSHLGLTFANNSDTFVNYNKEIPSELYLDSNNNSLGYTFRDVLDELAEVTASTICINDNDELEIRYPKSTTNQQYTSLDYITGYSSIVIQKLTNISDLIYVSFRFKKVDDCYILYTNEGSLLYQNGYLYLYYGNTLRASAQYTFQENTDYTIRFYSYNGGGKIYINNTEILSSSNTMSYGYSKAFFRQSVENAIFDIYYIQVGNSSQAKYNPVYNLEINSFGLLNQNTFINTNYKGNNLSSNDTIDKEYLKDINVNFGKKYGPINTVVLSRTGGIDKISKSIPENLDDSLKNIIEISDNQIMNFNNRDEFRDNILNKLYGLEYYVNDFTSTGITYYDLCDEYNIQIGENSYNCIMLNDDIQVTKGLEELIHSDENKNNVGDYKNISNTDRGITQANVIANKAEGKVEAIVSNIGSNGEVTGASLILAINNDTSQASLDADKISLTGKTIDLTSENIQISSTNFSVSQSGNITANSGDIGNWKIDSKGLGHGDFYISYGTKTINNVSYTFGVSNIYTMSDVIVCQAIILGTLPTPTAGSAQFKHFDINNNGSIDAQDLLIIQKIVEGW